MHRPHAPSDIGLLVADMHGAALCATGSTADPLIQQQLLREASSTRAPLRESPTGLRRPTGTPAARWWRVACVRRQARWRESVSLPQTMWSCETHSSHRSPALRARLQRGLHFRRFVRHGRCFGFSTDARGHEPCSAVRAFSVTGKRWANPVHRRKYRSQTCAYC
jgi:hypothetical protein